MKKACNRATSYDIEKRKQKNKQVPDNVWILKTGKPEKRLHGCSGAFETLHPWAPYRLSECSGVYTAEEDDMFYVISDESALAEML